MSARTQENGQVDAQKPSSGNDLTGDAVQVGAPARVGRLKSLADIRAEHGRLYRESRRRHGRFPDAVTAQRLSNILGSLRESVLADELRQRIEKLEAALNTETF